MVGWRSLAFRVSLWALIALLYFFSPFILVVLGWFQEPFSDLGGAESVSHRVHEFLFGVLFAQAMVGAVSQLRNPIGRRAGMLQTVLALVGLVAALAAIGEVELLGIAFVALSITAMVLHPASRAEWKTSWHPQPGLVLLAVSGLLPMVLLAVDNFAKAQVRAADHLTHWGGVAAFAIVQILLALTAALRPPGYRLVAGSVGGAVCSILGFFTLSLRCLRPTSVLRSLAIRVVGVMAFGRHHRPTPRVVDRRSGSRGTDRDPGGHRAGRDRFGVVLRRGASRSHQTRRGTSEAPRGGFGRPRLLRLLVAGIRLGPRGSAQRAHGLAAGYGAAPARPA